MKYSILIFVLLVLTVIALILFSHIKSMILENPDLINEFLSSYDDQPVFNPEDFPWTANFRDHWWTIRDEFISYSDKYSIPSYKDINLDVAHGTNGWKTLFLRAYNVDTMTVDEFPETMKLINSCSCTTAYFSVLEPGTKIPPHVGLYKGVIRYHLGIIVPTDREQCFINVDNRVLHWQEGKDIMFDDMFEHYVENNTTEPRVVLFLDIKRDFRNPLMNIINNIVLRFISSNDELQHTVDKANELSMIMN